MLVYCMSSAYFSTSLTAWLDTAQKGEHLDHLFILQHISCEMAANLYRLLLEVNLVQFYERMLPLEVTVRLRSCGVIRQAQHEEIGVSMRSNFIWDPVLFTIVRNLFTKRRHPYFP